MIEDASFRNNYLTDMQIPANITTIGHCAFCVNIIKEVVIPDSVTHIGSYAFKGNEIYDLTLSNSLTSIYPHTFDDNHLTNIIIPDSVKNIEDFAFGNNSISEVLLPSNLSFIGSDSFHNNPLSKITFCQNADNDWSNIIIEGVTPQLDENCDNSNDSEQPSQYSAFDLDQNGSFEALTDALLLLRYAFGLRGDSLINGAIATDANRTTASEIEAHIQSHLP
jgi:hypothetical protein